MSPTTISYWCVSTLYVDHAGTGVREGVPGVWGMGGCREGYTGVLPSQLPGSHIDHNLASGPYLRPNEGIFHAFDEVS